MEAGKIQGTGFMSRILSLFLFLVVTGTGHAQGKTEPLVTRVKDSIAKGVRYAVSQQNRDDGKLQEGIGKALRRRDHRPDRARSVDLRRRHRRSPSRKEAAEKASAVGSPTCVPLLSEKVYVRALQTMVFAEAGGEGDRDRSRKNVEWLVEARVKKDGAFAGWGYENRQGVASPTDASNSQYALLALWYAQQAGVKIDRSVWATASATTTSVRKMPRPAPGAILSITGLDQRQTSLTMSVAGLCGLLVSGMELNDGHDAKNCGIYDENPAVAKALGWVIEHFQLNPNDRVYYHLYGLERVGRLSGTVLHWRA